MKDINRKAIELLGRGPIHPALHVDDQGVIVGVMTQMGEYQLITSERACYNTSDVKDLLTPKPRVYRDLAGRWPDEDVAVFLSDGGAPTFSEVVALIVNELDRAMEFTRETHSGFVAVWIIATYFFPCFLTFPRLNLLGEPECGKSKLMMLLRAQAWNALYLIDPTPAVLFRLIHEYRPTMLLDEMENIASEDTREILSVVHSGYKLGGSVPRCEGDRERHVELFNVYSPMALAAIRALRSVTESRAIPLVLQRGVDPKRLNAEVDPSAPAFARVRSGCHRLLLSRWREVRDAYSRGEFPSWLNARVRELWRPLLTIADIADRENGLAVKSDLLELAREHAQDRDGASEEGQALLALLKQRLGAASSLTVHPGDLTRDLGERLGWRDPPTPHQVGAWLRRFFKRVGRDRGGAVYEVGADRVRDLEARYGIEEKA